MANQFISEVVLLTVMAVTIKVVESFSSTAAWLYALILMIGYVVAEPQKYNNFVSFFTTLTKSGA